ncbi:MAG: HlyC/CorC family transporter [Thermoanaerobaculia bacterium]|nr:HlyC/CorC family transporter [Thermoanaerobaculia bacterium]
MTILALLLPEGAGGAEAASGGMSPWLGLALGLLLVALNGFFVAAEFALVKVRPTQLDPLAQAGSRRAKLARHQLTHLDAYLSACQLGITIASLALGWVGEPAFSWIMAPLVRQIPGATEALVHSVSLTTAFIIISALHIVVGEMAPKSFAIRRPQPTALWIAMPLYVFYWVIFPAIWLLNHAANGLLRLVGLKSAGEEELAHSEEELRILLSSSEMGSQSKLKREILDNVFELSLRNARQVMVPRADVTHLSTSRPFAENLEIARQSGHTRFPLCERDLDSVIGLIHIKDLFRSTERIADIASLARPVKFVPETTPLDRLLGRMQAERQHMVAVVDEYGGVSGIVTLENVIEEIVGEIQDEFDTERPELARRGDGSFTVAGSMLVVDLEDELGLELSTRDEDTIAGVVLSELGRKPRIGDRVALGEARFEVLELQGNRIRSLGLELSTTEPPPGP